MSKTLEILGLALNTSCGCPLTVWCVWTRQGNKTQGNNKKAMQERVKDLVLSTSSYNPLSLYEDLRKYH